MIASRHWIKLYWGVTASFLAGCSGGGCSSDDGVQKNPAPKPTDNGAEQVNCECEVRPTTAGSSARLPTVTTTITACLPADQHDSPDGYCQGFVAPWLLNAVEQTTINSQKPSTLSTCTKRDLTCGVSCDLGFTNPGRLYGTTSCKAVEFPGGTLTDANAECEAPCENVPCDDSCVPGVSLATCACTVVTGCGGPIGPVCSAPSVASSSEALTLAPHRTSPMLSFAGYQQQGTWDHGASTLEVHADVDACVDLILTTTCATVGDSATPHVGGKFNLYGAPCPGKACQVSLETDLVVDDFDLEFALLGVTVGRGKPRHLRMVGASEHVSVDAQGNGVFPQGSFAFEANGHDEQSGDSYRITNDSKQQIAFHVDWATRTLSISNVALSFPSGSATLNLTGHFQQSLLEGIAQLDSDGDGIPNTTDNCPLDANADQLDRTIPSLTLGGIAAQTSCGRDAVILAPPTVFDRCAPGGSPKVTGAIIQSNGVVLVPPVGVGLGGDVALPPGRHVVRWTATDASGNASNKDQVFDLTPCLATLSSVAVGDRARLQNSAGGFAQLLNYGSGSIDVGVEAQVGSLTSRGSVALRDRSSVEGSLLLGGTLTRFNQVIVTGSITQRVTLTLPDALSIGGNWPAPSSGDVQLEPDRQRSLTPGTYGAVAVKSRARLTLAPGTYYFASLTVEPQGALQVDGANTIQVRDSMLFRGSAVTAAAAPAPIALRYRSASTLFLERGWYGSVLAPQAPVVVGGTPGATLRGQLFARSLELRPDVVVRAEAPISGGILQP